MRNVYILLLDWYKAFYTNVDVDMYSLTTAQIDSYVRTAGHNNLKMGRIMMEGVAVHP